MGLLPKPLLQQLFDQAAASYDSAAMLFREIGDRLIERLDFVHLQPQTIVDLGSGTGYVSALLQKKYPVAQIITIDFSLPMLKQITAQNSLTTPTIPLLIGAEAEQLPLLGQSVDLVISNEMLPWCENMADIFAETYRILKPGGLFLFSSFGPDTLYELRSSFEGINAVSQLPSFLDLHEVGDVLKQAEFADPVVDMEFLTLTYDHVHTLLADSQAMTLLHPECKPNLDAYEEFRDTEGKLPLSFEIVYGHACRLSPRSNNNDVIIPIDAIRRA